MSQVKPKNEDLYLVEQRNNQEVDLEHIDEELRMEQVRQNAEKLDWASFGQAVRRNMMEKRNTLDAEARIDVLKGISYMRSQMPIDLDSSGLEKFRIMAESLGCAYNVTDSGWSLSNDDVKMDFIMTDTYVSAVYLSFWDEPSYFSQKATTMLQEGKWTDFRNVVAKMLSVYAKDIVEHDKGICKGSMKMLEMIFNQYSTETQYTAINHSGYGYYLPRGDLRNGRLYYIVEPLYQSLGAKQGKQHIDSSDYDLLPYLEFAFIKHSSPCQFPKFNVEGLWDDKLAAHAAACLKLSKGFLMTVATRMKLAKYSAKTVSIRHYTNAYRHLTGQTKIHSDLVMITQFKSDVQHLYTVDYNSFKNEGHTVITEIYLKNIQEFHEVINILRNEIMHLSLWESILAMCYERQGIPEHSVNAINMNVTLSREEYVISFNTLYAPIKVYIREGTAPLEFKVEVINAITGLKIADRIDETLSRKLNETWSIPTMLTYAVSGADCNLQQISVPLRKENPETVNYFPPPKPVMIRKQKK